jgi:hypothetical protein
LRPAVSRSPTRSSPPRSARETHHGGVEQHTVPPHEDQADREEREERKAHACVSQTATDAQMGQRSITPVSDALIAVPHLPLAATTTDLLVRRLAGAGVVAVSKDAERFARVVGRGRLEEEGDTGDDWGREGDEGAA